MKKINEDFICIGCKKRIPKALKTCRNHCPYCFASLHVDDKIPGDRKSNCQGIMKPIAYEFKNGMCKILFECTTCGKHHRNKSATDDELVNLDKVIALSSGTFQGKI